KHDQRHLESIRREHANNRRLSLTELGLTGSRLAAIRTRPRPESALPTAVKPNTVTKLSQQPARPDSEKLTCVECEAERRHGSKHRDLLIVRGTDGVRSYVECGRHHRVLGDLPPVGLIPGGGLYRERPERILAAASAWLTSEGRTVLVEVHPPQEQGELHWNKGENHDG
ncbi:MAG: hypothetical protein V3T01_04170, partial [Myxococcota bacterium]